MSLALIQQQLSQHIHATEFRTPLGSLGVFHSQRTLSLRRVPIHLPTMVLIVNGTKFIYQNQNTLRIKQGELLLAPGNCALEIANHPSNSGDYFALALSFSHEAITQFTGTYAAQLDSWKQNLLWQAPAPEILIDVLKQWVSWCRSKPMDLMLIQHRQVEILLILAQHQLSGNLLNQRAASWKQRIVQLLYMDISRDWQLRDLCLHLGVSESTLRRHLQTEGTGFRDTLEEVRLVAGMSLLQETFWPIQQIAQQVGYQSQSRFAERFKKRFDITPSELRRTRMDDCGEQLTV